MTAEEIAQKCMDARGYVVISTNLPLAVGERCCLQTQQAGDTAPSLDKFAVVIAETTQSDWDDQVKLMGFLGKTRFWRFYRMVAE